MQHPHPNSTGSTAPPLNPAVVKILVNAVTRVLETAASWRENIRPIEDDTASWAEPSDLDLISAVDGLATAVRCGTALSTALTYAVTHSALPARGHQPDTVAGWLPDGTGPRQTLPGSILPMSQAAQQARKAANHAELDPLGQLTWSHLLLAAALFLLLALHNFKTPLALGLLITAALFIAMNVYAILRPNLFTITFVCLVLWLLSGFYIV